MEQTYAGLLKKKQKMKIFLAFELATERSILTATTTTIFLFSLSRLLIVQTKLENWLPGITMEEPGSQLTSALNNISVKMAGQQDSTAAHIKRKEKRREREKRRKR